MISTERTQERLDGESGSPTGTSEGAIVRLPAAVAALSLLIWLIHVIRVITGPELKVMEWLYDDCFYYIITAWHLSLQGISSFDGVTRTTGYHPLWMWVCAGLVRLHPALDMKLVRLCMTMSATISLLLAGGAYVWALRRRDTGLLWALAIASSSYSAWNNGLTVMEWPVVVLCWTALHILLTRLASADRCSVMNGAVAVALGFLLTLSRTDSGLIAASYTLAAFFLYRRSKRAAALTGSILALGGCVAGLALTMLYNQRMTGTWMQQSAEIKHLYGQVTTPFNPLPALWQFSRTLLFVPPLDLGPVALQRALNLAALPVAAAAVVVSVALFRLRTRVASFLRACSPVQYLAVMAAVIGIPAYAIVYGFAAMAMYGWYTAPVTGFMIVLTAGAFRCLPQRAALATTCGVLLLNGIGLWMSGGNGRGQLFEVDTGRYMHEHYPGAVLSGGDVGKASFYNSGAMLNTDGLMNNEVVPYLREGRVHCYLLERHIQYATGLGSITSNLEPAVRARLGLPALDWNRVLTAEGHVYDGRNIAIYIVKPEYIRATRECTAADAGLLKTDHLAENGK